MAIIDDKIICMHGGLSPDLNNFDQIHKIKRPVEVPDTGYFKLFQVYYVIYYGLIQKMIFKDGVRVKEVYLIYLDKTLSATF